MAEQLFDPLGINADLNSDPLGIGDVLKEMDKKPEGGFKASAKQIIGQTIKGAGQAAADYLPFVGQDNPVKKYGQSVVDANPTAIHDFPDILDKPWTTVKEAAGNAAAPMAGMVGARAAGMGITAAAPLAGPLAPVVAAIGQGIAWLGPMAIAALPSYSGIRDKQILDDPLNQDDAKAKAIAALGAGAVGAIETRFGPQNWALAAFTKEGREKLAEKFASTTLAGSIGKGALRGAAIEGSEELVQNPIEQLSSFDDPRTPKNVRETLFGGAMGAIGGGVFGGAAGGVSNIMPPAQEPPKPQLDPREKLLNDTAESVIAQDRLNQKLENEARQAKQEKVNDRKIADTAADQAPASQETGLDAEVGRAVAGGYDTGLPDQELRDFAVSEGRDKVIRLAEQQLAKAKREQEDEIVATQRALERAAGRGEEVPSATATAFQAAQRQKAAEAQRIADESAAQADAEKTAQQAATRERWLAKKQAREAGQPISPKTVAGEPVAAKTDEQLQALATSPETPAITRHAAVVALQARAGDTSAQPVAEQPESRQNAPGEAQPAQATQALPAVVAPQEPPVAQPPALSSPADLETKTPPALPKKPGTTPPSAKQTGQTRITVIDAELAKLQAQYEKKMEASGRSAMVPPSIKADALKSLASKMDKLDAEKTALLAAQNVPNVPNRSVTTTAVAEKGTREPWEMTRGEFAAAVRVQRTGPDMRVHLPGGETNLVAGTTTRNKALDDTRRFVVQRALAVGKPIPAAVLADYPDLVQKSPESPAPVEQKQGAVNPVSAKSAQVEHPAGKPEIRIFGQLLPDMTVEQLQHAVKNAAGPDWRAATAAELKTRDKRGETAFGKTVDQLNDGPLAMVAKKHKNKGLRAKAQAEIDARAAKVAELADRVKAPGIPETLKALADEAGWAERGGHLVRQKHSEVAGDETISRTKWIPRAEWWPGRPVAENEQYYRAAVAKAIAGEKLTGKQAKVVAFMLDLAEHENGFAVEPETTQADVVAAQELEVSAGNAPDAWGIMTEDQKDEELDSLFGEESRPVADAQTRSPVGQGEVGQAGPLELATQTEADLAAKTARENDQTAADRERIKREPEAGAASFTLQPPEKPVAISEAEGKAKTGDLFAQPAETPAKTAESMSAADHLEAAAKLMRAAEKPKAETGERFEAGKALTKDERKQVLATLVDVYKAKGADQEVKGQDRDGNDIIGYVHSPDLFEKSDITGAMVRYHVTLPDGRLAHPTELFPDYTQNDIDAELQAQRYKEQSDKIERKSLIKALLARKADTISEANKLYWAQQGRGGNIKAEDTVLVTNGSAFIRTHKLSEENTLSALGNGWSRYQPNPEAQPAEPVAPGREGGTAGLPDVESYSRGEPAPRLAVLHNLNAENLIFADKLGGLAVPSLGVVREGMGISGMGDITLIGRKELADPAENPIHDADVYSNTFPRAEYDKVRSADAQVVLDQIKPFADKFDDYNARQVTWDNAVNSPDPQKIVSTWANGAAAKAMFLQEKGIAVEPVMTTKQVNFPWVQFLDWDKFREIMPFNDERAADVREKSFSLVKPLIRSAINKYLMTTKEGRAVLKLAANKADAMKMEAGSFGVSGGWINTDEPMPPSLEWKIQESKKNFGVPEVDRGETRKALDAALKGRETEFKQWVDDKVMGMFGRPFIRDRGRKYPYNLENIVDAMTGRVRAREDTMTFGEGKARAAAAKRFKDLEQMRRAAENIADESEIKESRETAKKLMEAWRNRVVSYYGEPVEGGNQFGRVWDGLDASMKAMARWARGAKTEENMRRALSAEGFRTKDMPEFYYEDGVGAGMAWLKAPVPYFEAKPQRAVKLSEFAGAVIPENTSEAARAVLDKNNIQYKTYRPGEKTQQQAAAAFTKELAAKGDVTLFSQTGDPGPGLPAADIRAHISAITDRLSVAVPVYDGVEAAREAGFSVADDAQGFAVGDQLGLVSENIKTLLQAEITLFHELWHVGIKRVTADRDAVQAFANYNAALNRVAAANPEVRRRALAWREKYGADKRKQFEAVGVRGPELDLRIRLQSFDEAVAEMAGDRRGKPVKFLTELVASLQRLVRALGFDNLANWMESASDAEVLSLIRSATQTVGRDTVSFGGELVPSYAQDNSVAGRQKLADRIDAVLHGASSRVPIYLGDTPKVLQRLGLDPLPMGLDEEVADKAMFDHGVSSREMKALADAIADPVAVVDSESKNAPDGSLVVITDLVKSDGRPIIVAVHPDEFLARTPSNGVASVYPKDNAKQAVARWLATKLRYVNNEKRPEWQRLSGVQFPGKMPAGSANKIVLSEKEFVKGDFVAVWGEDPFTAIQPQVDEPVRPGDVFQTPAGEVLTVLRQLSEDRLEVRIQSKNRSRTGEFNANQLKENRWDKIGRADLVDGAYVTPESLIRMATDEYTDPESYSRPDQTQTAEFKAWFKDSKVTDAGGKPLMVFHGTPDPSFTKFEVKGGMTGKLGFWFTDKHEATEPFRKERYAGVAPATYPVYLSLQNPKVYEGWKSLVDAVIEARKGRSIEEGALTLRRSLMRQGYDGIINRNSDTDSGIMRDDFVAFRPEQIKSAIGNRGTFDPGDPNIMQSRAPAAAFNAIQQSRNVSNAVAGMFKSPSALGPLNWINTPFHKAEMLARKGIPGYKRVFERLQHYLNDTAGFATQAEQLAPQIFRELKGIMPKDVRQYFKGAADEADIQAIGPWLNHGTLYGGGSPLQGVVWTDAELSGEETFGRPLPRDLKPLTKAQIPLYHQARAAINQSLETSGKAVIHRHVAKYGIEFDRDMSLADVAESVREQITEKIDALQLKIDEATEKADEAFRQSESFSETANADRKNREARVRADNAKAAYDKAQKRMDNLQADMATMVALRGDTAIEAADKAKTGEKANPGTIRAIAQHAQALIDHGYMPLKRFGRNTVTAIDEDGKTRFFGTYDGTPLVPGSANKEMLRVAQEVKAMHPEWTVKTGTRSEKAWKMYQGLSMDALENFLDFLDPETKAELERDKTIQEYLKTAVNDRSVLKQLIHRKGTPGFSNDVPRVLSSFIVSHARNASGLYHLGEARRLVGEIPQEYGTVIDEASDLVEYVSQPGEESAKLRSFLFFNFLGGSIAAAAINLTQTPLMTAPFLLQHANIGKLTTTLGKAAKLAVGDPATMAGDLGKDLQRAELEGVTAPQQIFHLAAMASNNPFSSDRRFRTAMAIWNGMFGAAEVFNRRVAFIAAHEVYESMTPEARDAAGFASAYDFANDTVDQTQLVYNRGNRPNASRGTVGAVVFTFKMFSIGYVELLRRLPPQQQLIMIGMLLLMAGAEGLPFEEDIADLADTLGQWLGFTTNTGKWTGKAIRDTFGQEFERPILKGLGGMLPIDLHSRLGLGNLLPGTAFFKQSEVDKTRDVAEAVGPFGGVLKSMSQGLQLLARGKWDRAAIMVAPKAARDFYNGAHIMATGESLDTKGRLAMRDMTAAEGLGKAIGFNPQRAAMEGEVKREDMLGKNLRSVRMDEIASDWADGILRKDSEKQADARNRLREWNLNNPELRIDGQQILRSVRERVKTARMTSQERFLKALPRSMRPEARGAFR